MAFDHASQKNIYTATNPKRTSLALQGGGSLCAHQAAALIEYLKSDSIRDGTEIIVDITGTSGGAINAGLVASGLVNGGPEKAIKNLEEFWHEISKYNSPITSFTRTVMGDDVANTLSNLCFSALKFQNNSAQLYATMMRAMAGAFIPNPWAQKLAMKGIKSAETASRPMVLAGLELARIYKKYVKNADLQKAIATGISLRTNYVDYSRTIETVSQGEGFSLESILSSARLKEMATLGQDLDGAYAANPNVDHLLLTNNANRILYFAVQDLPDQVQTQRSRETMIKKLKLGQEMILAEAYDDLVYLVENRPDLEIDVCNLRHPSSWDTSKNLFLDLSQVEELMIQGRRDFSALVRAKKTLPVGEGLNSVEWLHNRITPSRVTPLPSNKVRAPA